MSLDRNKIENIIEDVVTCNIIDIVNYTIFLVNYIIEDNQYNNLPEFKDLLFHMGLFNDNSFKGTYLYKLSKLNIDYNLLQSNMIGFSPINSNMWEKYEDDYISSGDYTIYNDLTKYEVDDIVKFKNCFYKCKNTTGNIGLFEFYDIMNNVVNRGLINKFNNSTDLELNISDYDDLLNTNNIIYVENDYNFSNSESNTLYVKNKNTTDFKYICNYLKCLRNKIYSECDTDCIVKFIDNLNTQYTYLLGKNDNNNVEHKLPRCYDFITKKIGQDFNFYRINELKEDDTLDLSEKLREFSTNDNWKNNEDLWSLIAAACNDVGSEFYIKIKKYISNLNDIETCNVRGLKSIATSVGYDSNVLHIYDNLTLPKDLKHLIDLFSINRKILFDQNSGILSESSVADIIGYIDVYRNYKSTPLQIDSNTKQIQQKLPYKTIYKIKNNIVKLEGVLNKNIDLLLSYGNNVVNTKYWSFLLDDENYSEYNTLSWSTNTTYNKDDVVYVLLNNQHYFFKALSSVDIIDEHPLYYTNLINQLKNIDIRQELTINELNVFTNFVQFLQQNIMLYDTSNATWTVLDLIYINEKTNAQEYMLQIVISIIQSIQQYDLNYRYQFVMFHIFGLFYSRIFNYELDPSYSHPTQSISEYSIEEFTTQCEDYIGSIDIVEYLNMNNMVSKNSDDSLYLIKNLTQNDVDFIKYTTILFSIICDCDTNNTSTTGITTNNIYKHFYLLDNVEQTLIIKHIIRLSMYLTDLCIKISYERELIKQQIKKYALSGTSQIVENVLSDYFMNNFSQNEDSIFNDELNGKLLTKDQLNNTLKPFSIEFVEYQDNTNYFNIDAELPQVVVGQKITGYETYIHESINNRGELVQTEQTKPIYQDVYSDQSTTEVNDKYWESTSSLSNNSDVETYKDYYNQWLSNDNELETYLTDTVTFINDLYSTFNSSGTGDEELDGMLKFNTESKINSNIKNHKNKSFPSIATLQFLPNLVESSNTYKDDSLVISKTIYDSTVQYLNAILLDIINNSDYNRDDYYSIIQNGWKSDLVEYNGYTSYYEDSNNKNTLDLFSDKRIDVDGPWVYSSLQQFLFIYYNKLLNFVYDDNNQIIPYGSDDDSNETVCDYVELHNQIIYEYIDREFIYDQQSIDDFKENVREIYKQYLFDYTKSGYGVIQEQYDDQVQELFSNELFKTALRNRAFLNNMKSCCMLNFIQHCNIFRFEKDVYNNQYTLFKRNEYKDIEDVGQLWVRLYNHPLSVPLEAIIEETDSSKSIINIANNCLTFKCVENTMWMLGYDTNSTTLVKNLKLVIFNFTYNSNSLYMQIEDNSINYISDNDKNKILPHINSYIGDYVDTDSNIHILIYNYSLLDNQTNESYKFNIYDYKYNIQKEYIELVNTINSDDGGNVVDKVIVNKKPLLLDFILNENNKVNFLYKKHLTQLTHSNNIENNCINYKQNHIWSVNYNSNKNQLYIGYEFYNDNFILESTETLPIDDVYNGYQKTIFNCPVIQYKIEYENNKITEQLNSNVATKLYVTLKKQQFELFYKSDANIQNNEESYILQDSIIELMDKTTQQNRNSVLCIDNIIIPIWTLIRDDNITSKTNPTNSDCNYIYNTYIQLNGSSDNSDNKSGCIINKIKTYIENITSINQSLKNQLVSRLNAFLSNNSNNIFEITEEYSLLVEPEYYDINNNTYNDCINLFNDCMNCMNQVGLMKFNFTTKFNTENINNENILNTINNINNITLFNNNLDLDVSVRVLVNGEYSQTVGWKCMNTQSSNINWLSSDNTSGGPELVSFDVASQIKLIDNSSSSSSSNITYPICAHWFSNQTSSVLNSIEVFYKGYYKELPFVVLPYDTGCSIHNILDVDVKFSDINNTKRFSSVDINLKDIYYGVLVNWVNKPFATVKVLSSDNLDCVGDYTVTQSNKYVWEKTGSTGNIYNAVYHNKINYYLCNESVLLESNIVDISNNNYWKLYNYSIWFKDNLYVQNDIVLYNSEYYKCINDTIVGVDITNNQYWCKITKDQAIKYNHLYWNAFNNYIKNTIVVYNNDMYMCIKNTNVYTPNTDLNNTQSYTHINVYDWVNNTSYNIGDVVKNESKYYICIKKVINPNTYVTNQTYWTLIESIQYNSDDINVWNINNNYVIDDLTKVVVYYRCIKNNNNTNPTNENDSWEVCTDSNILNNNNITAWKNSHSYIIGDIIGYVLYYKCIKNTTTNIQLINNIYWKPIIYKYQSNNVIYNYEFGWDVLNNVEYLKYLNNSEYQVLTNTVVQTTGNVNNDKYDKIVNSVKIIYSTNSRFNESYKFNNKGDFNLTNIYNTNDVVKYENKFYVCIQQSTNNTPINTIYWKLINSKLIDDEYIYVGYINQNNIINEYVNNINNFATVQVNLADSDASRIGIIGHYIQDTSNPNKWNCLDNNNIIKYTLLYNNSSEWVLNDINNNVVISRIYYNVTTTLVKDISIRQYIINKMYYQIKMKLFDNINKQIMLGTMLNYNIYNDQKFTLLNNKGVDSDYYYTTLYDFININNYSQYNDCTINNIIF